MQGLLNPDSRFMRCMSRVGDLLLLNLYFILTSIPIVTIGASLTAMYTVCFRFGSDREGSTTKCFFEAFRDNFRQATLLWLLQLLLLVSCSFNVLYFSAQPGWMHLLSPVFLCMLALILMVGNYLFALQSQFENRIPATIKNGLILCIAWLPRSLIMGIFAGFPLFLLFKDLYIFLQSGFIFIVIYFSAVVYLNTILLKKVFSPFLEETDTDNEEETR